ncbi:hypothetical protein WJX73_001629 [Symbiochloris irregularis]|uniref:Translation initiation factor IF-2, chloroplastic n=1 Tax=Symbiochloris irregularis TaxID=706552 RepID=A0AAW1P7M3_9CHLO
MQLVVPERHRRLHCCVAGHGLAWPADNGVAAGGKAHSAEVARRPSMMRRQPAAQPSRQNGDISRPAVGSVMSSVLSLDEDDEESRAQQRAASQLRSPPKREAQRQRSGAEASTASVLGSVAYGSRAGTDNDRFADIEDDDAATALELAASEDAQRARETEESSLKKQTSALRGPPKRPQPPSRPEPPQESSSQPQNGARGPPSGTGLAARPPTLRPRADEGPARPPKRREGNTPGRDGGKEEGKPSFSRRGFIDQERVRDREGGPDRAPAPRKRKVSASARRAQRQERAGRRAEERNKNVNEQEEIFEVGAEGMSVAELSQRLAVRAPELLAKLFERGIAAHVNQVLDRDMVKSLAEDFDVMALDQEAVEVSSAAKKRAPTAIESMDDEDSDLQSRPPVVTVMGHVDHGKTSLLDYIRKSKVAAGEAGGITQAIGAYTVELPESEGSGAEGPTAITFLDTPGHEAFSAMRARGTRVTDVAVIVVAADDGVRPQTEEAISHARAAEVPIIIAINKIDKEGANVERVKQQLSEAGLLPEEWGGQTPMCEISAKKGMGVDELLETVLLVAEVEELSADPTVPATGSVIEAHMDRQTGPVATLLVASGTLRAGDIVAAGGAYGKVRSMQDSLGSVSAASPSFAVQMVGLNALPVAGDDFVVCGSDSEARKKAAEVESRIRQSRLLAQSTSSMVSMRSMMSSLDEDGDEAMHNEELRLNLILKVDASGSLEAVRSALGQLPQDTISLRFLHAAAGPVTGADIDLAAAAEGSLVIAFNTSIAESVMSSAKTAGVEVLQFSVIYELIDRIRAAMEGQLDPFEERIALGEATVRAVFGSGSRRVAGCMVTEGSLKRDGVAQVIRKKKTIYEGKIMSLRRVKDDVKEIGEVFSREFLSLFLDGSLQQLQITTPGVARELNSPQQYTPCLMEVEALSLAGSDRLDQINLQGLAQIPSLRVLDLRNTALVTDLRQALALLREQRIHKPYSCR